MLCCLLPYPPALFFVLFFVFVFVFVFLCVLFCLLLLLLIIIFVVFIFILRSAHRFPFGAAPFLDAWGPTGPAREAAALVEHPALHGLFVCLFPCLFV